MKPFALFALALALLATHALAQDATMSDRLAALKARRAAQAAESAAQETALMEKYGREVLGLSPQAIATLDATVERHNLDHRAKAAVIMAPEYTREAAERAALAARHAMIPRDRHTLFSTWTDARGVIHLSTTTCTFYHYHTECSTR